MGVAPFTQSQAERALQPLLSPHQQVQNNKLCSSGAMCAAHAHYRSPRPQKRERAVFGGSHMNLGFACDRSVALCGLILQWDGDSRRPQMV
jgi:hypothetical protein